MINTNLNSILYIFLINRHIDICISNQSKKKKKNTLKNILFFHSWLMIFLKLFLMNKTEDLSQVIENIVDQL